MGAYGTADAEEKHLQEGNYPHLKTRIDEHLKKDKKSNIYKHLHNNEERFSSFNSVCFSMLDRVPAQFQIKIKEGMYTDCEKPNLNKQLNHLATTLSIYWISHAFFTSLFYLLDTILKLFL